MVYASKWRKGAQSLRDRQTVVRNPPWGSVNPSRLQIKANPSCRFIKLATSPWEVLQSCANAAPLKLVLLWESGNYLREHYRSQALIIFAISTNSRCWHFAAERVEKSHWRSQKWDVPLSLTVLKCSALLLVFFFPLFVSFFVLSVSDLRLLERCYMNLNVLLFPIIIIIKCRYVTFYYM